MFEAIWKMVVVCLLSTEWMQAAVAHVCGTLMFGSSGDQTRHVGYAHIMVITIVTFQQKKVNVLFTLSFRG